MNKGKLHENLHAKKCQKLCNLDKKKFIKKTSNDNSFLSLIQTNHDNLKINMNMNTFMPMYILQYHGIITKLSEAKRKL